MVGSSNWTLSITSYYLYIETLEIAIALPSGIKYVKKKICILKWLHIFWCAFHDI